MRAKFFNFISKKKSKHFFSKKIYLAHEGQFFFVMTIFFTWPMRAKNVYQASLPPTSRARKGQARLVTKMLMLCSS